MVEEGTEPPPPDIRNQLPHPRHHVAPRVNHSSSASICEIDDDTTVTATTPAPPTPDYLSWSLRGPLRFVSLPLILFIVGLSYLPASLASHVSSESYTEYDAYTSAVASAASDPFTSGPQLRRIRPTPILSFLSNAIVFILRHASKAAGFELVPADQVQNVFVKRLSSEQKVEAAMIPVLVLLSGVFAGLTLGYFSVDPTQLQVLSISGTPKQQEYARRILPIRRDSHLLLTTLILANMIVNEALPVIADPVLGGGIQAVVISTALVVIFAEIIPQSICSRYGLLIGATMAKPVRVLTWIFFPIGWPVAKLLEYILGAHHGIIYRRSELRELIKMHAVGGEGGGDLDFDTVTMAQGALDLAGKTVKDAMTPIDSVFMLPIEAKLDYETLGEVVRSGHSRIPVYQMVEVPDINLSAPQLGSTKTKLVKKVLGSLLVKSCVLLDPEDATPLATIPINAIPSVPWNEPLTNMLNAFQEGRSHMAIVSRRNRKIENDPEDAESVMTAAAGGLRQRLMRKVAEISHGKNGSGSDSDSDEDLESGKRGHRKRSHGSSNSAGTSPTSGSGPSAADKVKADAKAAEVEAEKKKRSTLAQAAKLNSLEQSVPADAELPAERVEMFFDGLEGAPLGIITLEDVLEELIGEEIYDEYDEHGGPRNAASAFVPREAALAARKAALDREKEKLRLAETTPLPATNDADIETPAPAPAPGAKRTMPKLPLAIPKFSLKRPASGPGKSRTEPAALTEADKEKAALATAAAAGSTAPSAAPTRQATPGVDTGSAPTSALPMTSAPAVESPGEIDLADPRLPRSGSGILDPSKTVSFAITPASPPTATPAAAAPAAAGTTKTSPVVTSSATLPAIPGAPTPAPAPPLLAEALMIERGRRRLAAAGGGPAPPALAALRTASVSGTPRAPSRQPTPPIGATTPAPGAAVPAGPVPIPSVPNPAGQGAIVSPMPRRTPKFKSVPTPLAATPVPSAEAVVPTAPAAPATEKEATSQAKETK